MKQIYVAMDMDSKAEALVTADKLDPETTGLKVGPQLIVYEGMSAVRQLQAVGFEVMLDLNLMTTAEVVGNTIKRIAATGVALTTVNMLGGEKMLVSAMDAVEGTDTELVAVTLLSSVDEVMLNGYGLLNAVAHPNGVTAGMALMAVSAGIPHVTATVPDLPVIMMNGYSVMAVGVRAESTPTHEHKRWGSAYQCGAFGVASMIVGRPVLESADPAEAVKLLLEEYDAGEAYATGPD